MKRIAALFLIVCMAVALFAGCGGQKATPINIGALKGPTGMGMVCLLYTSCADAVFHRPEGCARRGNLR